MGSGASIHVEPYLDNETASLSDESSADDESMDTVNMSDESSDNESFLSIFFTIYPRCFGHFYKSAKCFTKVLWCSEGKEVSEKS
jgi:hypothetical protein